MKSLVKSETKNYRSILYCYILFTIRKIREFKKQQLANGKCKKKALNPKGISETRSRFSNPIQILFPCSKLAFSD